MTVAVTVLRKPLTKGSRTLCPSRVLKVDLFCENLYLLGDYYILQTEHFLKLDDIHLQVLVKDCHFWDSSNFPEPGSYGIKMVTKMKATKTSDTDIIPRLSRMKMAYVETSLHHRIILYDEWESILQNTRKQDIPRKLFTTLTNKIFPHVGRHVGSSYTPEGTFVPRKERACMPCYLRCEHHQVRCHLECSVSEPKCTCF